MWLLRGCAEARIVRTHVPATYVDATSMYPTVNALLGTWRLLTADRLGAENVTDAMQDLLADPELYERCFDRDFWRNEIGVTLVEADHPDGAILPIQSEYDENSLDPGIGVNPLRYHGDSIDGRKRRCSTCNSEYQTARMEDARAEQWNQRRKTGNDPSHGGTAAKRRGNTNRNHENAIAAWKPDGEPIDPDYNRTTILPALSELRARTIAEELGVSDAYARQIRKGTKTPHPRHWPALQQIGSDSGR